LLSLELEKFGAFDRLRLVFRWGARLHVVYGPNEAGKSTALAAVGALLFGVPERTSYAYHFAGQELRIGAEIVASDGRALAFRRRKGRKNTLQGSDGQTLSDDALAPFLGALGEDVFRRSFGLDAAGLRRGGEAMLKADGDLGAAMLEAASGLRGLVDLRKALDDEAEGVFGERKAGHRLFYQALDRFSAARDAIREKELRVDEWKKLNADIESLSGKLDQVRSERRAAEAERARLSRLRRSAPVLNDIREREARLQDFADLPAFAPGAAERLGGVLDAARAAAEATARAGADEHRLVEELERIAVNSSVLAEAPAIEALFQASGGYAKEKRDLPRIQAEADGLLAALDGHARSLGLADADALELHRPTAAAKAELRRLIAEGRKLSAAAAERAGRLAEERKAVEALRAARENRPAAADPKPLREKYAALGRVAERARRLAEARAEHSKAREDLADAALRLDPPAADLDALARAPLPRGSDVARLQAAFDEARDGAREAAKTLEAIEKEMRETTGRIASLVAGRPLATAERIDEARAVRDEAWGPLRASLIGAGDAPPPAALPAAVTEFERLKSEADRMSDDANADAGRLAEHGIETLRLDEATRRYALAQAAEALASQRMARTEREWRELWAGVCAQPRRPADMREWANGVSQLLAERAKLRARQTQLDAEQRGLSGVEPILAALALESGLMAIDGLDCALLSERVERRLEEMAGAWEASREVETRFTETRRRLEEAAREEGEVAAQLADWRARWDAALNAVALDAGASIEAAETALEVWDKAFNDAEKHRDRARRVAGMRRNMNEFESDARGVVARCAPDVAELPCEAAARLLNERLVETLKAQTQRNDAAALLDAARQAVEDARARQDAADEALASLAERLPAGADPAAMLARERERAQLAEALRQRRIHLIDLADGVDEMRLAEEMMGFDPDAAAARLAELARRDEDLGRIENDLYAQRSHRLRERDALEAGVGAEEAWQQRRNAEAELLESARRWAVLKAASALLNGALERHRAARRDPLMTRAAAIFAMLTGEAFEGLDQSFDEEDELRLVCVRRGGERVPVAGLSEGTRDQLYLALRLAYIEDYASRAEAPPFIGDDLFASFDPARTAHGLEALAAIGDRVQPILFTHHPHVVEAAHARLGAAADIIRIGFNSTAAIAA
jgi:uncharacterized protein YhaN